MHVEGVCDLGDRSQELAFHHLNVLGHVW